MKEIDLVHSRISSIPALRLERFTKVEVSLYPYQPPPLPLPPLPLLLLSPLPANTKGDDIKKRCCLRQNAISAITGLDELYPSLKDLDLYDNLITRIENLESLVNLTSLDLSFNKIKHIKHVNCLKNLTDLYFVQNRIARIENLDGLGKLRNLELAANRIRVSFRICYFQDAGMEG